MTQRGRRWLRAAATTVFVAASLWVPASAQAHPFLVSTSPQAGDRLQNSPPFVELRFTEAVAGGERIDLKTPSGKSISTGQIQRLSGAVLRASLPPLENGIYVVAWQAVGSDGELVAGDFAFAVGSGGQIPVARSTNAAPISWPKAAAASLVLVGLLVALGGLVSERWVWHPVAARHGVDVPRAPVRWALGLALLGTALQLWYLAGRVASGGVGGSPTFAAAFATRPVLLALLELILVAYALWLVSVPVGWARPWALLPTGLALGTAALLGHAGTVAPWWGGLANVIHVVAAGLWVGALGHLAIVARRMRIPEARAALGEGAQRYATLALLPVAVALASGLVVALSLLPRPAAIVGTTYGRILLLKTTLVVGTLALALVTRLRALAGNPRPRIGLMRRLTGTEALVLVAVVAAAAVLSSSPTPPPALPRSAANLLGPPPLPEPALRLAGFTGNLAVYLGAAPGRLEVVALAPGGRPAPATSFRIQGRAPDGREIPVAPRPCGAGCAAMRFSWAEGTTTLSVAVDSRGVWKGGRLSFSVPWPPRPESPGLLRRVAEKMRTEAAFTLTELVSSGTGTGGGRTFTVTGQQFMDSEPYASGAAVDVRLLPPAEGLRRLTLFLPGSSIWFLLEIDEQDRLRGETVVNPGHLIERTFAYGRP